MTFRLWRCFNKFFLFKCFAAICGGFICGFSYCVLVSSLWWDGSKNWKVDYIWKLLQIVDSTSLYLSNFSINWNWTINLKYPTCVHPSLVLKIRVPSTHPHVLRPLKSGLSAMLRYATINTYKYLVFFFVFCLFICLPFVFSSCFSMKNTNTIWKSNPGDFWLSRCGTPCEMTYLTIH